MKQFRSYFIILTCCVFSNTSFAQTKQDAERWLQELDQPYNDSLIVAEIVWLQWNQKGGDFCYKAMQLLEEEAGEKPGRTMQLKLDLLKAFTAHSIVRPYKQLGWDEWCRKVIQKATELGDDHLLQSACYIMGVNHLKDRYYEAGLFYCLKGIELAEKIGFSQARVNGLKSMATSYLCLTHNYDEGIRYCNEILRDSLVKLDAANKVGVYNNLGLCYRAKGQYDLAAYNFRKAAEAAQMNNMGVWVGIAKGNIGDVLNLQHQPDAALPLWQQDVDSCLKYSEWENAGLSLAFISEYLFNKGKTQEAFTMHQRAGQLTALRPQDQLVLLRIKAGFFRQLKQYDSALIFSDLYHRLNDSLNNVIARSNYGQLKLRLDFENNVNQYKLTRKEKEAETTRRNLLLAALVIVLLSGWLLLNRQRLKYRFALQQKLIAENEAQSARDQLQLFTQTLLEKNQQIEQLSGQLNLIRQQSDDELIQQAILTDEDWNRFRQLFEKAHPGFFDRLKKAAPDITMAEMRLAALIKLNLDNKQMASLQGISLSSLRGNKTRLRQRLNIAAEGGVEEFVRSL